MTGCKRVAAIQDISGLGRCSLTVVIPVLSAMGVQVCPVPTAVLSAHTGYQDFDKKQISREEAKEMICRIEADLEKENHF